MKIARALSQIQSIGNTSNVQIEGEIGLVSPNRTDGWLESKRTHRMEASNTVSNTVEVVIAESIWSML